MEMEKGKYINKWRNVNIFFLYISGFFHMHFGVHFLHCNLETTGIDEVLFDKYTMGACQIYMLCSCLKSCMESVIIMLSVSYWFRYWDLQLLLTNVLGGGKKIHEIENLLLKIALTAPSKACFLNDTIMPWFIYFCIEIKVPSKHHMATEQLPYGQIHF